MQSNSEISLNSHEKVLCSQSKTTVSAKRVASCTLVLALTRLCLVFTKRSHIPKQWTPDTKGLRRIFWHNTRSCENKIKESRYPQKTGYAKPVKQICQSHGNYHCTITADHSTIFQRSLACWIFIDSKNVSGVFMEISKLQTFCRSSPERHPEDLFFY